MSISNESHKSISSNNASEFLIKAVQQLASARTMSDVALVVRHAARQLVGADGATFIIKRGTEVLYADEDAIGPLWKGQSFPIEGCISGWVIINKQQLLLPDIYSDNRIPAQYYRSTFVKSMVMTPVRKSDPIAAIGTYWQTTREFTQEEADLLQTLADTAALAMETVTLLLHLEHEVVMRTKELAEARDQAIKVSELKSSFVASTSHELRTPLSGIISTAELLDDTQLDTEQRQLVDILLSSASGLLGLLNNVLDLAKIESGRIELEHLPFSPLLIAQDVFGAMTGAATAKGLNLRSTTANKSPQFVSGDPLRLRQILMNLVNNAIKFTEHGEIVLSTDLINETENSATLRFSISDTGIGMSPKQIERLFLPFEQLSPDVHHKFGGTGLGLSITKQLVDLIGGSIKVESKPNQGSIFSVEIPYEKAQDIFLPPHTALSPNITPIRNARILIVEDSVMMQRITLRQLQSLGANCTLAENGKEALKQLKGSTFDLILMDCHMPELDGFETARAIRRSETGGQHIPIVAITAGAMSDDQQRCRDAGMDGYLTKPVTMDKLIEALDCALAEKTATPDPR
jgi:two-component system, chemotaxis family, CheB/CheR fusion protein